MEYHFPRAQEEITIVHAELVMVHGYYRREVGVDNGGDDAGDSMAETPSKQITGDNDGVRLSPTIQCEDAYISKDMFTITPAAYHNYRDDPWSLLESLKSVTLVQGVRGKGAVLTRAMLVVRWAWQASPPGCNAEELARSYGQ